MRNQCGFTYFDLLEKNSIFYKNLPALIDDSGVISHGNLLIRARELSRSLASLDIRSGDRIALLAQNNPQTLELLAATGRCGAILILLNTRSSRREIESVISDSGARHVFVDASLEPLIVGLPVNRVTCHVLSGLGNTPRVCAIPEDDLNHDWPIIDARVPLIGIPTAAVDGRPRIALLSHEALLHQAFQLSARWSLGSHDRHLCILPLFHMAGLSLSIAAQLVGGAIVLRNGFEPVTAINAIEQYKASFFSSFSPILSKLLDAADARRASLSSLRIVTGLESPDVVAHLTRRCPNVRFWNGYGQTEAGGIVTLGLSDERIGSVGRPLTEVRLRIAKEDDIDAGIDEVGEILVRSPGVFSGYWKEEETNSRIVRGGWHHTGDLGRLDADGYLWYKGRATEKRLIKSGGENIYPAEVEQALLSHPAVAQVRVIGVPDEKWGEAVRAFCVLQNGSQVQEQELIDFVGTRIARFKRPKEILFVDSLVGLDVNSAALKRGQS